MRMKINENQYRRTRHTFHKIWVSQHIEVTIASMHGLPDVNSHADVVLRKNVKRLLHVIVSLQFYQ